MKELGRNDLCHCGSGKKFKKCCLNKNAECIIPINWEEERLKRKDFIKNNNLQTIYTTNTEIIFGYNEEYFEDEGREFYLGLVERIKGDPRFKVSKVIPDYTPFYPYFEIMYLSSDCAQLNIDYNFAEDFDFNSQIDLAFFEIEMNENYHRCSTTIQHDEYCKLVSKINGYIQNIDWNNVNTKDILTVLRDIGITNTLKQFCN